MNEEPKPCPICGEEIVRIEDHHGFYWAHQDETGPCPISPIQLFDAEDIEEWNRRATDERVQKIEATPGSARAEINRYKMLAELSERLGRDLLKIADEQVRELVETLRPFADAAAAVDLDAGDDWCIWGPQNNKQELPQITVRHLRQAAAILRKYEKEPA